MQEVAHHRGWGPWRRRQRGQLELCEPVSWTCERPQEIELSGKPVCRPKLTVEGESPQQLNQHCRRSDHTRWDSSRVLLVETFLGQWNSLSPCWIESVSSFKEVTCLLFLLYCGWMGVDECVWRPQKQLQLPHLKHQDHLGQTSQLAFSPGIHLCLSCSYHRHEPLHVVFVRCLWGWNSGPQALKQALYYFLFYRKVGISMVRILFLLRGLGHTHTHTHPHVFKYTKCKENSVTNNRSAPFIESRPLDVQNPFWGLSVIDLFYQGNVASTYVPQLGLVQSTSFPLFSYH